MEPQTPINFIQTLAEFTQGGGVFMWVIFFVWGLGISIALERLNKYIFQYDVDGSSFMNEIQRYVLSNDIQGALRVCSGSKSMLARVLKSGLKRSSNKVEQIQNAIDATALEVIPKIEKRMSYLNILANVSTLFGLLGTIQGLIESFSAISSADPAQKSEILAGGISKAMNTTALGLMSAISIMLLHAFLSNKSEKMINEIDEFSVKLLDLLGTKNK